MSLLTSWTPRQRKANGSQKLAQNDQGLSSNEWYLTGQTFGGEKCRKFGVVLKILSPEKFCPLMFCPLEYFVNEDFGKYFK